MSVPDLEKRFHVIILAGGEKGPLFKTTGFVEKALIPIHGIPMLSRVVRVFRESKQVGEIVVVGSQKLDDLCLLYTSPSPRDKRQSRMPSSA